MTDSETDAIIDLIKGVGYVVTNATKKVTEFRAPHGQTVYLMKATSRLNAIRLMVHPSHETDRLRQVEGVNSVDGDPRFHSNMTRFPRRIHKGKTPTAYGWQVNINTLSGLPRFLAAFHEAAF